VLVVPAHRIRLWEVAGPGKAVSKTKTNRPGRIFFSDIFIYYSKYSKSFVKNLRIGDANVLGQS
jgi:hypothetical protein